MKRYALITGVLAFAAIAIALVSVRPSLLLFLAGGALLGAIGGLVVLGWRPPTLRRTSRPRKVRRRSPGPPSPPRTARQSASRTNLVVALAAGAVVTAGLIAVGGLFFAVVDSIGPAGRHPVEAPRRHPVPLIRTVPYDGEFKLDEGAGMWRSTEEVKVPRADLREAVVNSRVLAEPLPILGIPEAPRRPPATATHVHLRHLLGSDWTYAPDGGGGDAPLVFLRERSIPFHLPDWPPRVEDRISMGAIHIPSLYLTLFPEDGSLVEVTAPDGFVREVDHLSNTTHFSGDETFVVQLTGLSHHPDRREIRLTVANGIGRSWPFEMLDSLSASSIVKFLLLAIAGSLVGIAVEHSFPRNGKGKA